MIGYYSALFVDQDKVAGPPCDSICNDCSNLLHKLLYMVSIVPTPHKLYTKQTKSKFNLKRNNYLVISTILVA